MTIYLETENIETQSSTRTKSLERQQIYGNRDENGIFINPFYQFQSWHLFSLDNPRENNSRLSRYSSYGNYNRYNDYDDNQDSCMYLLNNLWYKRF